MNLWLEIWKIIDLVSGDQPLTSADDSIVLLCNGEIYNYKELQAGLKDRSVRFKTRSDVEVLIYLYQEQGTAFIQNLNGQFAFAIYDQTRNRLLLARDPFGICPLYYTIVDDQLIFASEIKSILQHPVVSAGVNLTGLDQVFSFPGVVSPQTLFKNIHSLPPGHMLCVENGKIQQQKYADLDYPTNYSHIKSEQDYMAQLDELLQRSIRYRLQADVPVGFYLSGGLDSSLILACGASELSPTRPHSYSITFAGGEEDESDYQAQVAAAVGSQQHGINFNLAQDYTEFSRMIYHCECAVKESYNLCSLALSGMVKQHGVSVVLSGEGADELLGGYPGYRFDAGHYHSDSDDWMQQSLEEELREALWGDSDLFYEKNYYALSELKTALYAPAVNAQYAEFAATRHSPVDKNMLLGRDPFNKRAYLDYRLRLVDHLVADHGDRMGMANSVEIRYPFLDINLVKFTTTIPPQFKVRDGVEKYILKRVAANRLPKAIVNREKFGFHAAGTPPLLQQGSEWVNDMLSYARIKRQGYFNPDSIENLKQQYSKPGFQLRIPYEDDLLMIVLSFNVLLDVFNLPDYP